MIPPRTAIYGVVGLLVLAFLAVPVAPSHPYEPNKPDYCALSNEELPEADADGTPAQYSSGSYECTGAISFCDDGPLAGAPCKVCLDYTYQYKHRADDVPD